MPFDIGSIMGSSATGWALGYDIVATDRTGPGTSGAIGNLAAVGIVAKTLASDVANAFLSMGDAARDFDIQTDLTAYKAGVASEQIRGIATSMIDVTTTGDEAVSTLNALSRVGVGFDDLQTAAANFDAFGDAVGSASDRMVLDFAPAFKAWNIPIEDSMAQLDELAYLVNNSTYDVGTLASTLERVAPNLDNMNVGFDETIAILDLLEDRGINGRQAITKFGDAVRDATPDIDDLNSKLETTTDRLDDARASGEKLDIRLAAAQRDVSAALAQYQMGGSVTGYSGYLDALDRLHELQIDKQESDEKISKLEGEQTGLQGQITSAGTPEEQKATFYESLGLTPEEIAARQAAIGQEAPGTAKEIADLIASNFGPIDQLNAEIQKAVFNLGAGSEISTASQALNIGKDIGLTGLALKGLGVFGGGAGAGTAGTAGTVAGGLGLGAAGTAGAAVLAGLGLGGIGTGILYKIGAMGKVEEAGAGISGTDLGGAMTTMLTLNSPEFRYTAGIGAMLHDIFMGGDLGKDLEKTIWGKYGLDQLPYSAPSGASISPAPSIEQQPQQQSFTFNFNIDKMTPDYDAKKLFDDFQARMRGQRITMGRTST